MGSAPRPALESRYIETAEELLYVLPDDGSIDSDMAIAKLNSLDHDLLVRLDTKLDLVSVQVNEVRLQVAGKVDAAVLEPRMSKAEGRIESILARMYMMIGALACIELLLRVVLK